MIERMGNVRYVLETLFLTLALISIDASAFKDLPGDVPICIKIRPPSALAPRKRRGGRCGSFDPNRLQAGLHLLGVVIKASVPALIVHGKQGESLSRIGQGTLSSGALTLPATLAHLA